MHKLLLCLFIALGLTACGGEDSNNTSGNTNNGGNTDNNGSTDNDNTTDGNQTAAKVTGIYEGLTSSKQEITSLVDKNNDLWAFYENPYDNFNNGLMIGSLNIDGNQVSTLARDFNFSDQVVSNYALTGKVETGKSFNGTATQLGTNYKVAFKTQYMPVDNKNKASIATLVGNYVGQANSLKRNDYATFTINTAGKVISTSECSFTGTIKPVNLDNISYYEASITFSTSSSCILPGKTVSGVVNYDVEDKGVYIMSKTRDMSKVLVGFFQKVS